MRFKRQTITQLENIGYKLNQIEMRISRKERQEVLISMVKNLKEEFETLKTFINSQPDSDDRIMDQYGNKQA